MSECMRHMSCPNAGCTHDLQDTAQMLAIAERGDIPALVDSGASKAAHMLLRSRMEGIAMISTLLPEYLEMIKLSDSVERSMSDKSQAAAALMRWALREFGPRDIKDRKSMADSLRSIAVLSSECAALVATDGLMTAEETARCRSAGRNCCAPHSALLTVCDELARICTDALGEPDANGIGRIRSGSSSWAIMNSGARSDLSERRISQIKEWSDSVMHLVAVGHCVSTSIKAASISFSPLVPVSAVEAESVIARQLGPSDWE